MPGRFDRRTIQAEFNFEENPAAGRKASARLVKQRFN